MTTHRRFVRKSYDLLNSREYIELSSDAKVALEYAYKAAWTKKGNSPQKFKFGFSDIPKGLMPKTSFYRARRQLIDKDFLAQLSEGVWPNNKAIYTFKRDDDKYE